jgi:hypothetical protein
MRRERKEWKAVERIIGTAAGAEWNTDDKRVANASSGSRRR